MCTLEVSGGSILLPTPSRATETSTGVTPTTAVATRGGGVVGLIIAFFGWSRVKFAIFVLIFVASRPLAVVVVMATLIPRMKSICERIEVVTMVTKAGLVRAWGMSAQGCLSEAELLSLLSPSYQGVNVIMKK